MQCARPRAAGYDYIGFRLLAATPGGISFPLMNDPARVLSLRGLLADNGIGVLDIEMIRLSRDFDVESLLPFLECSAQLGARAVLVAGDDDDQTRLTESFVRLCEAAVQFWTCRGLVPLL